MSWKVGESDYQYIEDEVKLYPYYKATLREVTEDIILATPERDENGGGRSSIPSRPTENIAVRIVSDNRILHMVTYINATEQALNELDEQKKKVISAIFWNGRKSVSFLCDEYHVGANTLLRWKKSFLMRVGHLTGDKR